DLVEPAGLGQELEQLLLAAPQHVGEHVELGEEGVAPLDEALVVERGVPAGVDLTAALDGGEEALEAAGGVAVVGPEAGEVDVGDEEEAVGLDEEAAVAAGVPGQVHDVHDAPAEVEAGTVGEGAHVAVAGDVEL